MAGSWIQLISAPAEGQESSYLGLNRVTKKQGPNTLYPIGPRAQPTHPGMVGGEGEAL